MNDTCFIKHIARSGLGLFIVYSTRFADEFLFRKGRCHSFWNFFLCGCCVRYSIELNEFFFFSNHSFCVAYFDTKNIQLRIEKKYSKAMKVQMINVWTAELANNCHVWPLYFSTKKMALEFNSVVFDILIP